MRVQLFKGKGLPRLSGTLLGDAERPAAGLWPSAVPLLAAGLALLIYGLTAAPTAFGLDSAELTAGAYSLGLVHAPGYPAYLLLAHLFTKLPFGDIGYRVNLLSAIASAGMVGLLIVLIRRMTGHLLAAAIAGLSLGFSYYLWGVSVVAEVYSLQGLLLTGMLIALWLWRKDGHRGSLTLGAALAGLAAANNPGTLLWWPGLALLAWTAPAARRLGPRDAFKLGAAALLGLTPVLYLPLRSTAATFSYVGTYDRSAVFHPLDLSQWDNLLWYLSGKQFALLFPQFDPVFWAVEAARLLQRLWAVFLGVGLPLAILGAYDLWRRDRNLTLGLALTALPHAVFYIGYGALDKDFMFLPVFLIWTLFFGAGLAFAGRSLLGPRLALGLLIPAALLLLNLPFIDVSNSGELRDEAQARLQQVPPGSIYVAVWGDAAMMHYLQTVHAVRRDVSVVNTFFVPKKLMQDLIEDALELGRPVYFSSREIIPDYVSLAVPVSHGFRLLP